MSCTIAQYYSPVPNCDGKGIIPFLDNDPLSVDLDKSHQLAPFIAPLDYALILLSCVYLGKPLN